MKSFDIHFNEFWFFLPRVRCYHEIGIRQKSINSICCGLFFRWKNEKAKYKKRRILTGVSCERKKSRVSTNFILIWGISCTNERASYQNKGRRLYEFSLFCDWFASTYVYLFATRTRKLRWEREIARSGSEKFTLSFNIHQNNMLCSFI